MKIKRIEDFSKISEEMLSGVKKYLSNIKQEDVKNLCDYLNENDIDAVLIEPEEIDPAIKINENLSSHSGSSNYIIYLVRQHDGRLYWKLFNSHTDELLMCILNTNMQDEYDGVLKHIKELMNR